VVAESIAVAEIGGQPTALGLGEINVFPPEPLVDLGGLAIGDYVVRVVVYYSTGVAGNEDKAVTERFFRVMTDINPAVSPEVTPAAPCATLSPGDPTPGLSLRIGDGEPVPGVDLADYNGNIAENGAVVSGLLTEPLILTVDGDACATSWKVEWLDSSGGIFQEVVQLNRSENPFLVSQNRIVLTPEQDIFGNIAISATVQLGLGRTVEMAWELDQTGPSLPPIQVRGPTGEPVIAVPSCGVSWTYASGRQSYETCESMPIPETVRLLTLRSGDLVTIEAPGMDVRTWSVNCGTRGGSDGTEFEYGNCDLGGGRSGPMRFLPYAGRWMIQFYVTVASGPDEVSAPYFVELLVED